MSAKNKGQSGSQPKQLEKDQPGKAPVVTTETARCSECGSTERERFNNTRELYYPGTDDKGNPYTHIVWRRTRCVHCKLVRVERTFENRPNAEPKVLETSPPSIDETDAG